MGGACQEVTPTGTQGAEMHPLSFEWAVGALAESPILPSCSLMPGTNVLHMDIALYRRVCIPHTHRWAAGAREPTAVTLRFHQEQLLSESHFPQVTAQILASPGCPRGWR